MKVLYFLFEGFDTANGTNHLALTTMKTLLENDIDVYLVTSHSKGLYPDIPDSLINKEGFTYSVVSRGKVEKKSFIKRYLDGVRYAQNASKEWKKHTSEIDVVILQSTPSVFLSSLLLRLYLKKPIIYNNFDVFPDGPYLFGAIKSKAIYMALSLLQRFVYNSCKRIVVISEDMRHTFINKGVSEKKLVTIPNWYDATAVREVGENSNQFIKKYGIDRKKFIVQYAGNIGYTFNYHAFIEVAKILKNDDNIEFHIIGTGAFAEDFKKEALDNNLNNIKFFPWQDSSIINDVYSACDIEFVPLSKGVIWTSFPSKCSLLMACGRTFLCMCEKKSEFFKFVNSNRFGICVARTDYERAADRIKKIEKNRELLNMLEENAKVFGKEYYSSEVNAIKYVELVKEVVRG